MSVSMATLGTLLEAIKILFFYPKHHKIRTINLKRLVRFRLSHNLGAQLCSWPSVGYPAMY
jgi:hypothetical protein